MRIQNSEFRTQISENYFVADPESEAHSKYNLLTTILHEMAHLYGFIEGCSRFDSFIEEQKNARIIFDGEHLDEEALSSRFAQYSSGGMNSQTTFIIGC